jgi:peptidoglycan hydrolase-like protein with peptidoglycan-binding domain
MSRRVAVRAALGVALLAGLAVTLNATGLLGASAASPSGTVDEAVTASVATAEVELRTLTIDETLEATLGYSGELQILNGLAGTLTRVPALGTVLERGDQLYEVDGKKRPVLMYGSRPAWRTLRDGMSDGADIRQLEENLDALGFARSGLRVDRHWTSATTAAVKRWQRANGMTDDGSIALGEVVFATGAIRVTEHPAGLGLQVGPGQAVLRGTSDRQVVTVDLDADRVDLVAVDAPVSVELPDGSVVDGTVTAIGAVAEAGTDDFGAPSAPTVEVTIALALPEGAAAWEQAPVEVRIVRETRDDVLAVPVNALVALLEGGYAVERVGADGTTGLVGVDLGIFQDGWVEVRTDGLEAGDAVAVPS